MTLHKGAASADERGEAYHGHGSSSGCIGCKCISVRRRPGYDIEVDVQHHLLHPAWGDVVIVRAHLQGQDGVLEQREK